MASSFETLAFGELLIRMRRTVERAD